MNDRFRRSTQELLTYGVGGYGGVMLTGQVETGSFVAMQAISDVTLTSISGNIGGISVLEGGATTLPAGSVIFGQFTMIEVASGTALAYYA